jgi:hypothetical protein
LRECPTITPLTAVIPRAGGGSSTPRLLDSIAGVSGILDRPPSRTMTTGANFKHTSTFPRRNRARVVVRNALEKKRAQGMPGARCARSRAWCVVNTRVSHHGHTGTTRHSPRNGFNGCFALSPVTGLFCHRHRRNYFRQLDTSVGASGPHDFTVRLNTARLRRIRVHGTRPAAVTIACRPSVGRDSRRYSSDLWFLKIRIFLRTGLDRFLPDGQISRARAMGSELLTCCGVGSHEP